MKPCGILFFVLRQITQLIAVMQIQPIQSADFFDFVFSCGQSVLSDSYRFLCKRNDENLLIFRQPTLDCFLGIILSKGFKSYRLLVSFRNNRPILSAVAERMLIAHLSLDKEQEGSLDEWDIVIDTNIKALLAMTRLIVPGMVERKRGHIINIGSIAGDAAYPGGSVYCATKAAVKALSDGLRIDLVDTPLRVTNIKPGLVETNFSVVRFRGDKEKADNVYKGIRPLTGDDIAETVYFAASVPEYMQIAEMLVMPTNQATGTIVSRK